MTGTQSTSLDDILDNIGKFSGNPTLTRELFKTATGDNWRFSDPDSNPQVVTGAFEVLRRLMRTAEAKSDVFNVNESAASLERRTIIGDTQAEQATLKAEINNDLRPLITVVTKEVDEALNSINSIGDPLRNISDNVADPRIDPRREQFPVLYGNHKLDIPVFDAGALGLFSAAFHNEPEIEALGNFAINDEFFVSMAKDSEYLRILAGDKITLGIGRMDELPDDIEEEEEEEERKEDEVKAPPVQFPLQPGSQLPPPEGETKRTGSGPHSLPRTLVVVDRELSSTSQPKMPAPRARDSRIGYNGENAIIGVPSANNNNATVVVVPATKEAKALAKEAEAKEAAREAIEAAKQATQEVKAAAKEAKAAAAAEAKKTKAAAAAEAKEAMKEVTAAANAAAKETINKAKAAAKQASNGTAPAKKSNVSAKPNIYIERSSDLLVLLAMDVPDSSELKEVVDSTQWDNLIKEGTANRYIELLQLSYFGSLIPSRDKLKAASDRRHQASVDITILIAAIHEVAVAYGVAVNDNEMEVTEYHQRVYILLVRMIQLLTYTTCPVAILVGMRYLAVLSSTKFKRAIKESTPSTILQCVQYLKDIQVQEVVDSYVDGQYALLAALCLQDVTYRKQLLQLSDKPDDYGGVWDHTAAIESLYRCNIRFGNSDSSYYALAVFYIDTLSKHKLSINKIDDIVTID
jgi:hypothetical protein